MEWDRFRRCASWMRRLYFGSDSRVPEAVLRLISLNLLNEIVFPGLWGLSWIAESYSLPFYRLFISPHLTAFTFICPPFGGHPDEVVSNFTSMIAELQTSSLRSLQVDFYHYAAQNSIDLNSAVSSAVLRCGSSLTTLSAPLSISDAAVQHIMQLPELTSWTTVNGPPRVSDSSPSDAFSKLETLRLHTEASVGWVPFFGASARRASSGRSAYTPPSRGSGQQLTTLVCRVRVSVDATFISHIAQFHGLVNLTLRSSCSDKGRCTFGLTDDDIAEVATALPNLVNATFGDVCTANSCQTTVYSLLFLSTRCKGLDFLEIHFNTTNICDDLTSMPGNPRLRDFRALPRCQLDGLEVSHAPLQIQAEDCGPVATGFLDIFPSLRVIIGVATEWDGLNLKLSENE
jgi:hypothetical protein